MGTYIFRLPSKTLGIFDNQCCTTCVPGALAQSAERGADNAKVVNSTLTRAKSNFFHPQNSFAFIVSFLAPQNSPYFFISSNINWDSKYSKITFLFFFANFASCTEGRCALRTFIPRRRL